MSRWPTDSPSLRNLAGLLIYQALREDEATAFATTKGRIALYFVALVGIRFGLSQRRPEPPFGPDHRDALALMTPIVRAVLFQLAQKQPERLHTTTRGHSFKVLQVLYPVRDLCWIVSIRSRQG